MKKAINPCTLRSQFCTGLKSRLTIKVQSIKHKPKGYPSNPKTLGQKLRKHRMDLDLKQKDVAKLIGTSPDTITNWVRGRTQPDKRYLEECRLFIANI